MTNANTPQMIQFVSSHGLYQADPEAVAVQLMSIRYFNWSVSTLQSVLSETTGVDFDDVHSVVALAIIAAEVGANLGVRA